MAILEVKNLRKSFGKTEVLKGIDFSLEKGEVLSIIGSSGSGKTTLLRCLNFLETAENGTISVNGKEIFDGSKNKKYKEDEIRKKVEAKTALWSCIPKLQPISTVQCSKECYSCTITNED